MAPLPQSSKSAPNRNPAEALWQERKRQVRGLVLLGSAILLFSILRAGLHRVFPAGWWRLW